MALQKQPRFKLSGDFAEWSQLVKGDVFDAAEDIARTVRDSIPDDVPVRVTHKKGYDGRPVALVIIAHPSGLPRQAKHGTLTRAAAERGLEVTRYKEG